MHKMLNLLKLGQYKLKMPPLIILIVLLTNEKLPFESMGQSEVRIANFSRYHAIV